MIDGFKKSFSYVFQSELLILKLLYLLSNNIIELIKALLYLLILYYYIEMSNFFQNDEFFFNDDYKFQSVKRFDEIRKDIVLLNANIFNDKSLNPTSCIDTLVDLIYILNQSNKDQKLSSKEHENLFFSVTKLFNSKNNELRRIVFLFLNHFSIDPNTGFILTGLLRDFIIQNNNEMLRINSLRLIGRVIDVNNMTIIDSYIKGCITSNSSPEITSSSIICTFNLALKGNMIAKTWIGEINDKLNSAIKEPTLVAFHILLLLKEIKSSDKLYLIKTYNNLFSQVKSQFATCQLIRYVRDIIKNDDIEDTKIRGQLIGFLELCSNKDGTEAIVLESVRAILSIPNCKESLVQNSLKQLIRLLSSHKTCIKYGALKTLNEICTEHSSSLALDIFVDLEKIIEKDKSTINVSFRSLALSIFLKVSKYLSDNRLEKMLKMITDQFSLFKEELKVEIITICNNISQKNESKFKIYFNFFASLMKLESSESTKIELIETIKWYINNSSEFKKQGIMCLAEFMEDCPYEKIKIIILDILGKESANINYKNQIIRYVYNRIILEEKSVRMAAISSLRNIALSDNEGNIRNKILILLKNCLKDHDCEIRERTLMYIKQLNTENLNSEIKQSSDLLKLTSKSVMTSNILKGNMSDILSSKDPVKMLKELMNKKQSDVEIVNNKIKETKNKLLEETAKIKNIPELDEQYFGTAFEEKYGLPLKVTKAIVSYYFKKEIN